MSDYIDHIRACSLSPRWKHVPSYTTKIKCRTTWVGLISYQNEIAGGICYFICLFFLIITLWCWFLGHCDLTTSGQGDLWVKAEHKQKTDCFDKDEQTYRDIDYSSDTLIQSIILGDAKNRAHQNPPIKPLPASLNTYLSWGGWLHYTPWTSRLSGKRWSSKQTLSYVHLQF